MILPQGIQRRLLECFCCNISLIYYRIQTNVSLFYCLATPFILQKKILSWHEVYSYEIKIHRKLTIPTNLKCQIKWFFWCAHSVVQPWPLSDSGTFLSLQKETLYLWAVTSIFSLSFYCLATIHLLRVFMDLSILDILSKVTEYEGFCVWHVLLRIMCFFQVHPYCSRYQSFTPFYSWIIIHCIGIPHFVVHSLVNGQLYFYHLGAIINNAAMNIYVQAHLRGIASSIPDHCSKVNIPTKWII